MADAFVGEKAVDQIVNLYILPEVERRQKSGRLPCPVGIRRAQVLFCPHLDKPIVRINEDFEIILKIKKSIGKSFQKGDPIFVDDIKGVDSLVLEGTEYENCGHITFCNVCGSFYVIFDTRMYKKDASVAYAKSLSFLDAAELSLEKKLIPPFVDNLFSACELSFKSYLLRMLGSMKKNYNSHKSIEIDVNRMCKTNNIDVKSKDVFKIIRALRHGARYNLENKMISTEELHQLLDAAKELIYKYGR